MRIWPNCRPAEFPPDPAPPLPPHMRVLPHMRGGDMRNCLATAFTWLRPEELGKVALTCHAWRRLASRKEVWDSYNVFELYNPNVIDSRFWILHAARYGLDPTGAPPLPSNRTLIPIVHAMSRHVEGGLGVTFLTMPKGLTLNKLMQFAQDHNVPIFHVWPRILEVFGDQAVTATHTVVITNSVFQNSRSLSVAQQETLVRGIECEMPDVLSVATLAIATYASSPEGVPPTRLYPDGHPNWTFTRCQEEIHWRLVVGGFAPSGLCVCSNNCDHGSIGVGGQRKF